MDLTTRFTADKVLNAHNLAMTISRLLLHEVGGHSKFRNKADNNINSPIKCVSGGKIKTMTYLANEENSDDLIKILTSEGIKFSLPTYIESDKLAGLEWSLNKFIEENRAQLIPRSPF